MFVGLLLQLLPDLVELTHLLAQAGNLLVQAHGLHIEPRWTGPVRTFNQVEISLNASSRLRKAVAD
jgi:hypothetical protein